MRRRTTADIPARRHGGWTPELREAGSIQDRLVAVDPNNSQWQRDLSVSHEKIGDMLAAQGNSAGALAAYRKRLAISERPAAADPNNNAWQRNLSVGHERIGNVLAAQDDPAGASEATWMSRSRSVFISNTFEDMQARS